MIWSTWLAYMEEFASEANHLPVSPGLSGGTSPAPGSLPLCAGHCRATRPQMVPLRLLLR